jgi:hypothetical protein
MRDVLGQWAQKEFGSVLNNIKSLRAELQNLRMRPPSSETDVKIRKTKAKLEDCLLREEVMWKQRSRIVWLREGDKNTEFFHRKATWRRKKNKIAKLRREDGSWAESTEDIHKEINKFFRITRGMFSCLLAGGSTDAVQWKRQKVLLLFWG